MIPLLVKVIGVRRLAGWGMRLIQFALLGFLLLVTGVTLYKSDAARVAAGVVVGVALCAWVFRAIWIHTRRGEVKTGERTIDGKVVPEMLAAAALVIPAQSPDADAVLRGLPDYGKMLLKLDASQFEYLPEVAPAAPLELPEPEPEEKPGWLDSVPRWAWASGVAALLIVIVVGMTQGRERHPVRDVALNDYLAAHAATTQAPQESAPAPLPIASPAPIAEVAPAPAAPQAAPKPSPSADSEYWTKHDNGPESLRSWEDAKSYCSGLQLGGVFGWRLPTIEQLERHYKQVSTEDLQLSSPVENLYSSTPAPDGVHHVAMTVGHIPDGEDIHNYGHAVCVHE